MTVHYVNGFTDSPTADCCGATLALLDASEITLNLDAVTCNQEATIYDEIRAERERAHAKHGDTSMEAWPTDSLSRLAILLEEVGEVAKEFNDARHETRPVDFAKLRAELVQVATMAAAWADRISTDAPASTASRPVPQAVTGTVADPSSAAAPVARDDSADLLELARRVVMDYGDNCTALETCDCSMAALRRAVQAGGAS